MRTEQQKQRIMSRYSEAAVHKDIVSPELRDYLLKRFYDAPKIVKNTGPVVMNYSPDRQGWEDWFRPVQELVDSLFEDTFVWGSNIFRVEKPHVIHNDDYMEKIYDVYKTIVLPLEIKKPTNFIVFDQVYLDGPVKLRRGYDKQPETYYNKNLEDYSDIINYTDKPFDLNTWNKYMSHVPYEALHGLTVEKIVEWKPGDAITFDMGKIHCAANFIAQGITHKIGYSIFTAKY